MKKTLLLLTLAFSFFYTSTNAQNGLAFDGTNDYVSTNLNSLTGNASRTIEAWIKTGTVTTQNVIVGMGTMPLGTRFTVNVLNGKLRIEIGGAGINSSKPVDDNTWHHIAVTYDNAATTKFKLYIDGALDGSGNITSPSVNTSAGTGVAIGRRNDAVNYFNGTIDEVRIWNTVRTAAEIQTNMSNELCNTTGLIGYYQFNHGTANGSNAGTTTATDNSGNNKNGTLNGFALSGSTSNWTNGATLATSANTMSSLSVSTCGNYTSPSGAVYSSSQVINDIIPNAAGCDSIITITLTVTMNSSSNITTSFCGSYTAPSGTVYTNTGVFTDTIPNAAGCDSLITLNLSTGQTTSNIDILDCDSYTAPSGTTYFSTQTFLDTIPNTAGCDSIITINLTIESADVNVSMIGDTLMATATNSTFQWIDCSNSMPISGATNATFIADTSGTYAVEVTTNLGNCVNASPCFIITISNTDKVDFSNEFKFYPNPTTDILQIETTQNFINSHAVLTSITGQTLKTIPLNKTVNSLNIADFPNGFYLVSIYNKDFLIHTQRVIIQK